MALHPRLTNLLTTLGMGLAVLGILASTIRSENSLWTISALMAGIALVFADLGLKATAKGGRREKGDSRE